jgi:NADH-quinone oxidoreductase subunit N
MSVLAFAAIALAGAVVATLVRGRRQLGTLVGFAAVIVALVSATVIRADDPLQLGGGALGGDAYLRLVLSLCLGGGLLVLIIARLATWQPSAPGVLLGGAAGIGLALGLAGAPAALLAAGAATGAAATLALASPAAPSRVRALMRELRGAATSAVIGVIAAAIVPATSGSGRVAEPAAAALVLVGMALVMAHRFGAIPLHARVSRLSDVAPSAALPVLGAWLPAAWGLIIIGWAPAALGPYASGLGPERGLIVALALVTLLFGTLAALVQDEVAHVVAYTIVADAGLALLALAALDPAARDAARGWLLVFAATRTALIGWTIAFRAVFETGRLRDTSGWLRRAPALGVALAGILVAAVGWPGLLAWDTRLAVLQSATAGPALLLGYAGSLGTGVAICRMLGVGAGRPSAVVAGAPGELPRLPAPSEPVIGSAGPRGTVPTGRVATARAIMGSIRARIVLAGREARPALELNRVPLRAFAVLMLAGLAFLVAAGAFGIETAARLPGLAALPPVAGG